MAQGAIAPGCGARHGAPRNPGRPDQILEEAAAAKIRPYRMARDEYDRDYLCNVMHA